MALFPCAECGEQVSNQAKACPKCGGPPPKKKASTKSALGCLALILFSCVGMSVIVNLAPSPSKSNQAATTQPAKPKATWRDKPDKLMAYHQMSRRIQEQLRSPSTASFPSVFVQQDHVRYLGDQRYEVNSWVDAQNAFGATVRTHFTGKIMQGSERGWIVLELETRQR